MTRQTKAEWNNPGCILGICLMAAALVITVACVVKADPPVIDWDAPGDDGNVGTATGYLVAWSLDRLKLEMSNDSSRTGQGFIPTAGVTIIDTGLPTPLPAGSPQDYELTGLPGDTIVLVAIKAFDERNNMGPMSNVMAIDLRDQIAPAAIILRLR